MKILMIAGSFPPMWCGAGDYVAQLARALASNPDIRLAVLTSRAASRSDSAQHFDFFPIIETWSWHELASIFKVIRAWKPDLVHVQYPAVGYGNKRLPYLLPLAVRIVGVPVVQTWHGYFQLAVALKIGYLSRLLLRAIAPGGLVVSVPHCQERSSLFLRWAFFNKTIRHIPLASNVPTVDLSTAEVRAIRMQYGRPNARLIVYFGFLYPSKRVELLFEIANPNDSHLVIIGGTFSNAEVGFLPKALRTPWSTYDRSLRTLAQSERWNGKVTMTGFLPAHEAARVISAADAVVLPFQGGAHDNSTSIHAAQAQGTFILTTSKQRIGYDAEQNMYFSSPDDLGEMRAALARYAGRRSANRDCAAPAWQSICESHLDLYRTLILKQS